MGVVFLGLSESGRRCVGVFVAYSLFPRVCGCKAHSVDVRLKHAVWASALGSIAVAAASQFLLKSELTRVKRGG